MKRFFRLAAWVALVTFTAKNLAFGMTALAADRQTPSKTMGLKSYPVAASATIYKGGMICIDGDGYAVPAADTSGFSNVVGVADEAVDNSAGVDGDKNLRVRSGEVYKFNASSITQAMVGDTMFVVDDNTVDETDPGNGIKAGILLEFVSTTSGWILINGPMNAIGTVTNSDLGANSVDSPQYVDNSIDKEHIAGGFSKIERVDGQDETSDTTIPVTGLAAGDELVAVFVEDGTSGKWTQRALTDFTLGAGVLNVVANAADTTGDAYIVFWNDIT